jgi:hypothetical protein
MPQQPGDRFGGEVRKAGGGGRQREQGDRSPRRRPAGGVGRPRPPVRFATVAFVRCRHGSPQHNREVCGQPWPHCIVPSPAHIVTGLVHIRRLMEYARRTIVWTGSPGSPFSRAAAGFPPGVGRALPFPDRQPVTTTGSVRRPPASPDYASSRGRLLSKRKIDCIPVRSARLCR